MAKRELKVQLVGDPTSLNRAFASVEKNAGRMGGKLASAAKIGAAALGGGLVLGAKAAIDAFGEAQKVAAQTEVTLKSTGGAAKVTAKEIGDLATAISRKSGLDDEAIQSGENLLLTFTKIRNETGKGNNIFTRAAETVADFSVTFKKDLGPSAILVGKALNDPIKGTSALSRVGVQFTEQQKKTIESLVKSGDTMGAQKLILKELETQTKGAAEAYGNTLPGKIGKAQVAIGNLGEAVGGALAPAVAAAADGIATFVSNLADSGRPAKFFADIKGRVDDVRDAIGGLLDDFKGRRGGGDSIASALGGTLSDAVGKIDWGSIGDKISDGFEKGTDFAGKLAPAVAEGISTALGQINGRKLLAGLLRVVSEAIDALFSPSFWKENFAAIFSTVTIVIPVGKIFKLPGAEWLFKHISKPFFKAVEKVAGWLFDKFKKIADDAVTGFLGGLSKLAPKTADALLNVVTGSGKWLKGLPRRFRKAASDAVDALVGAIGGGAGRLGDAIGRLVGRVVRPLEDLASKAFEAGKSAISALGRGLKSLVPKFDISLDPRHPHFRISFGEGKQAGGLIPGSGRGDIVPAMLEPGEFVIRKQVVDRFGPTFFAGINGGMGQSRAPGYSSGGIVRRANELDAMHLPYLWGGGHAGRGINRAGMDCSGAVSYALGVSPRVSGAFMGFGQPGPGDPMDTKIYANAKHVFAVFNGQGWGTSGENPGGGPGWLSYSHRPGFTIRHLNDGSGKGSRATVGDTQEAVEAGKERRIARQEKSGSRLVNKIAAAGLKGAGALSKGAASLAGSIGAADTAYGLKERFFGQVIGGQAGKYGDEDLGTAGGRKARISELVALKRMKSDELREMKKRASALRGLIGKYEKTVSQLQKARGKARGAKRAKMSERIKAFVSRLSDYKAELLALGESIESTKLDIGDLQKDIQDVAATPDTPVEAPEAGPTVSERASDLTGLIDLRERAGLIDSATAQQQKIDVISAAIQGKFGATTEREQLQLMGDLKEAQDAGVAAVEDNTSALRDLIKSIDDNTAFAKSVMATENASLVSSIADLISGQIAGVGIAGRSLMPGTADVRARY